MAPATQKVRIVSWASRTSPASPQCYAVQAESRRRFLRRRGRPLRPFRPRHLRNVRRRLSDSSVPASPLGLSSSPGNPSQRRSKPAPVGSGPACQSFSAAPQRSGFRREGGWATRSGPGGGGGYARSHCHCSGPSSTRSSCCPKYKRLWITRRTPPSSARRISGGISTPSSAGSSCGLSCSPTLATERSASAIPAGPPA